MKKNKSSFSLQKYLQKILSQVSLLQIILLLCIVLSVIGLVKYFSRSGGEWRTIRIQVVGKDWTENYVHSDGFRPPLWIADQLKIGDKELNISGQTVAEVVDVESYERYGSSVDMYAVIKVLGDFNSRQNLYTFKGKPVTAGNQIEFHFPYTMIVGHITHSDLSLQPLQSKQLIVKARFRYLEPWVTQQLAPNMKMVNRSTDEVVATLQKFTLLPSNSVLTLLPSADPKEIRFQQNPLLKHVDVELLLTAEKTPHEYIFATQQVLKTGGKLWLYFPELDLSEGEIQSIQEL